MGIFDNGIRVLEQMGVHDVILPFALIFAITYAILVKIDLFSKAKQNMKIYLVMALVLATSVVFPHVMNNKGGNINPDVVPWINAALPQVSLVIIAIVMVLIMMGIWGVKAHGSKPFGSYIAIAALVIVIYIFAVSAGNWQLPYWLNLNSETIIIIVVLLVFGAIVMFITGEELDPKDKDYAKKKADKDAKKIFNQFKDFLTEPKQKS